MGSNWLTRSTRILLSHPRLTVVEDEVEAPDGAVISYLRTLTGHDAVTIICTQDDGRILMEREYAYPIRGWQLQFPGGGLHPGEAAVAGASRELEEECGLRADSMQPLESYFVNLRKSDERMHVFVGTNLHTVSQRLDPGEEIELIWLTAEAIDRMVATGSIVNATALAAWALYRTAGLSTVPP